MCIVINTPQSFQKTVIKSFLINGYSKVAYHKYYRKQLFWKTCKFPNTFSSEISRTSMLSIYYYLLPSALKFGEYSPMLNPFLCHQSLFASLLSSSYVFRGYRKRPVVFAFLGSFLRIFRTSVNPFELIVSHHIETNLHFV